MAESLKKKTADGLFWGTVSSGATQVLNLVIGIFLARLLSPDDYGIVGVLTIFTAIAGNLQDSGFTQGLINIREPRKADYSAVFWFNMLTSLLLYAVLFFCAPLIARFFHEPRLVALSRTVFLAFVLAALGIVPSAYMKKNLMNREMAVCSIGALLGAGTVGVVLAFNGYAYWSLAWQQIAFIALLDVGRYLYSPWLVSLRFNFRPIRRMFRFSVNILLTNIISTLSTNVLTFFFGRLYPMKDVGNYSQARKWSDIGSAFVASSVGGVAQPIMVSVLGERERELKVFRKMLRFTAFLSFPLMFGLALVAREFIVITIGEKWLQAAVLLQALSLGGAFFPFYTLYQNLAISHGRSAVFLWLNSGFVLLQMVLLIAIHRWGILPMVAAYSLLLVLWLLTWHAYAHRAIGIRLRDTLRDVAPFCLAALVMASGAYVLTLPLRGVVVLFVARVVIAVAIYYALMRALHAVIFQECLQFLKEKLHRRPTPPRTPTARP